MNTKRIERLRNSFFESKPQVSSERLVLATEAYKKYAGDTIPIFRAKVFAYVLDNMEIVIHDDELVVGASCKYKRGGLLFPEYLPADYLIDEIEYMPIRERDKMQVTDEDKKIIRDCLEDYWQGKSLQDNLSEAFDDTVKYAIKNEIFSVGFVNKAAGENVPNYEKLLSKGLSGYIEECKEMIKNEGTGTIEKQDKIDFWNACIISAEAGIRFAERYAEKAKKMALEEKDEKRKSELLQISENCSIAPKNSPQSFLQALQAIWLIHLMLYIEIPNVACAFGRLDKVLLPYYEAEKAKDNFDKEKLQEELECFFLKCGEPIKIRDRWNATAFAGFPMWAIVMVGGQDVEGNDDTNDISYMCLDAGDHLRTAQPVLAMRVHDKTPEPLFNKACEMIQEGQANPGFFNDKVAMDIVKTKGANNEEACNWFIVGCTQPHPGGGCASGHSDGSYLNGAKILELVLHNGTDPKTGKKVGLETGDPAFFKDKNDIIEACKKQISYFYKLAVNAVNTVETYHIRRVPTIYSSMVMDDCIKKGKSVEEGGTRYNGCEVFFTGPANVTDSIIAIEDIVFKEKVMTLPEFIDVVDKNFEGNEPLRQKILNESDKFGNDIEYVDRLHDEFLQWIANEVQKYKDARGGNYEFTIMTQTLNVIHGQVVGATPDGRKSGEPVSDNASPMMGRDVNGPTAAINSVAAINQRNFKDATLLNMRFDPRGIRGEKGINTLKGLVRTYFEKGGHHIQMNVVDDETLIDAQRHPENHKGLVVRIAGYMAYFTELDPVVQNALIQRTTHLS